MLSTSTHPAFVGFIVSALVIFLSGFHLLRTATSELSWGQLCTWVSHVHLYPTLRVICRARQRTLLTLPIFNVHKPSTKKIFGCTSLLLIGDFIGLKFLIGESARNHMKKKRYTSWAACSKRSMEMARRPQCITSHWYRYYWPWEFYIGKPCFVTPEFSCPRPWSAPPFPVRSRSSLRATVHWIFVFYTPFLMSFTPGTVSFLKGEQCHYSYHSQDAHLLVQPLPLLPSMSHRARCPHLV